MCRVAVILAMTVGVMGLSCAAMVPTWAAEGDPNCVSTNIIGGGEYCDDGNGSGVIEILNIVLTVLTFGVGILGVLGMTIAGIQYLTARDNEQQMAAAKKRIIEIVIGLAIYAVMWAALQWLLPGGVFGDGS